MYTTRTLHKVPPIKALLQQSVRWVWGLSLNMDESMANALAFIFGPARLIRTITNTVKKKESPMAMRKGIS